VPISLPDLASQVGAWFAQTFTYLTTITNQVGEVTTSVTLANQVLKEQSTSIGLIVTNVETIKESGVAVDLTPVEAAIMAVRVDTTTPHAATLTDVLAAIAALSTQIGTPISPTTPPDWYTAPTYVDPYDVATQVWNYPTIYYEWQNGSTPTTRGMQSDAAYGWAAYHMAHVGGPLPGNPYIGIVVGQSWGFMQGGQMWVDNYGTTDVPPVPDFSAWLSTDTVLSFLQRTQPDWGWQAAGPTTTTGDDAWSPYNTSTYSLNVWFHSLFTKEQAALYHGGGGGTVTVTVPVPPVYTTADHLTLGASHTLADGLVITGPLNGVVVDLTTAPSGASEWVIGGLSTYYNWGQVAFVNDNGDMEPAQFLTGRNAFYTPKQMTQAASAHFRVLRSPVGTARAFTIT
jgi:hypothetical protein